MDKKNFLAKRTKKSIAILMSYKERQCDQYLPKEISQELRKVILDEMNDLANVASDLISEDIIWNEEFYEKFDQIHKAVIDKG